MFRKVHWILTSPDGPTKIPYNRCLYLEVHCVLIEYKNRKAKLAHYLVQIVDDNNSYDQRQELFPKRQELVTNPAFARAIGFDNIYHQSWALTKQGKMLRHFENTVFVYDNEFKEYMKVERAVSEDIFDYLFDVGARKFLSKKGKKYLLELFEK